jgi:CheY-specific phosphatase CheX
MKPIIRTASNHMTPEQLVQMYGGLVGAAFGSMAADFGQPTALHLMQVMVAGFAKFQPLQETH